MSTPPTYRFQNVADFELSKFDRFSKGVTVIDETHRVIHEGWMYTIEATNPSLANGANLDIVLAVGSRPAHLQSVSVEVDGAPDTLILFEGTSFSLNGSVLTPINMNRMSSNTAQVVARQDPTIAGTGNVLYTARFQTDSRKKGVTTPDEPGFEWILASNTDYLIRFTNQSGGNTVARMHVFWYEIDWSSLS